MHDLLARSDQCFVTRVIDSELSQLTRLQGTSGKKKKLSPRGAPILSYLWAAVPPDLSWARKKEDIRTSFTSDRASKACPSAVSAPPIRWFMGVA